MAIEKTDSFIEYTCLVSFLIIIVAYKDHANWVRHLHSHTLIWDVSNYLARGILAASLGVAALGAAITLWRVIKYLFRRPNWSESIDQFRKHLKEPYEPTPWLNVAYGGLGFLIFPLPFNYLLFVMTLALFFSVTVRYCASITFVQNFLGIEK